VKIFQLYRASDEALRRVDPAEGDSEIPRSRSETIRLNVSHETQVSSGHSSTGGTSGFGLEGDGRANERAGDTVRRSHLCHPMLTSPRSLCPTSIEPLPAPGFSHQLYASKRHQAELTDSQLPPSPKVSPDLLEMSPCQGGDCERAKLTCH